MKKDIALSIKKHYQELFKKYGINPRSLGWTKNRQFLRFDMVKQIGSFYNTSILDVGCGFGDFYGYLKFKKIKSSYLGVDINEEFIEIAKKRYPKAKFEIKDIQKKKFPKKIDWVIAVGVTNHGSTYNHLKDLLKEMFRICKKGVVMDFVSTYVDYKEKNIFYTSPEIIFKFAKSLTRRVVLRHDYMPYEYCLYLYKNDQKNSKNVFTEYFREKSNKLRSDFAIKK